MANGEPEKIRMPFYEKRQYKGVFRLPATGSKLEAIWHDAYYYAAKRLIDGVARGEYLPAQEGIAGLYAFRHHLELALKYVIFHSRGLKDATTNARLEDIEDVKKTHSLSTLWNLAKTECQRIIPSSEWDAVDTAYVEQAVREFDAIDPNGERFRYVGASVGVEKDPVKRQAMNRQISHNAYIDFNELVQVVEHTHEILDYLDIYMVETHAQNEEWEEILRSF